MEQTQWQGMERRQSSGSYDGQERRKPRDGYQATDGTPGVNAEEPNTEQDERKLAQQQGPNPRIPK